MKTVFRGETAFFSTLLSKSTVKNTVKKGSDPTVTANKAHLELVTLGVYGEAMERSGTELERGFVLDELGEVLLDCQSRPPFPEKRFPLTFDFRV